MKNQKRVEELRELIDQESEGPVLSVFCRTDPRDPANSSETPAWAIALKNGLNHVAGFHEGNHGKEQTVKKLCAEAERRINGASAADRGRSVEPVYTVLDLLRTQRGGARGGRGSW